MRIAILSQYYPPEMGAPQARLSELAGLFTRQGHEVFILTAMPNYPLGKIFPGFGGLACREKQGGVTILRAAIYPTQSINTWRRLASYGSFIIMSLLVGAVLLPRVDFLITETPPLFLTVTGWLLAKLKKARWVLNVSDLWPDSAKFAGLLSERSFLYRLFRGWAHFFYRRAWLVTGQSREIVAEIERQVPTIRVYHLSNGVDPNTFHPLKRREEIRQRYLSNGEIGLVYAGLHGFFQGLEQVIWAANQLQQEPVRFVFFGDGPQKEALRKLARELGLQKVDFYPPLPHSQVAAILASMDVAVIPLKMTIRGAVPSKIYEAMASGIPVLLAADGEARQILLQAGAGVAIPPGETQEFVAAVRELTAQPGTRQKMGEKGRQAAVRFFDRFQIGAEFVRLLQQVQQKQAIVFSAGENSKFGEVQEGMTIHRADGDTLVASRGYRIMKSFNSGRYWELDGMVKVPGWRKVLEAFPLGRQISRGGVLGVWPLNDGSRLALAARRIMRAEVGSPEYGQVFALPRGSRPLNLCRVPTGKIYFGEYFLNLRRAHAVRVYGSSDQGRTWEPIHTFPRGAIAHIHRIVYDPFRNTILVCTGDRDPEAAIWETKDDFSTLCPIGRGSPYYRTTSLFPFPQGLLYATDNPEGENFVMVLERQSGRAKPIQELPGPVLHGCRVGEEVVFATMVEKKFHEVTLWAGNLQAFRPVAFFKTLKINQLWRELMGYSTVMLPEGWGNAPQLFCTPVGTSEWAGHLIKVNLNREDFP